MTADPAEHRRGPDPIGDQVSGGPLGGSAECGAGTEYQQTSHSVAGLSLIVHSRRAAVVPLQTSELAEKIQEQTKRHTNSSYFTMVAVDAEGQPIAIPPRPLLTNLDRRRYESARLRRKALRAAFEAPHAVPPELCSTVLESAR